MKAWPIRAAGMVALIQGLAHAALILTAKATHGEAEPMVVEMMKQYVFDFSGAHRSYWDLYTGYALLAAGTCVLEAALLWLLAPLSSSEPGILRALLITFVVYNLIHAGMVLRYFFFVPLAPDILVISLLLVSLLRRESRGQVV